MPQSHQLRITESTNAGYASHTVLLLARAFDTDPIFAYLTNSIPKEDAAKRLKARELLFRSMCALFRLDKAVFYEASIEEEEVEASTVLPASGGGAQSGGQRSKEESVNLHLESGGGGQSGGQGTKEENTGLVMRSGGGGQSSGQGTAEESTELHHADDEEKDRSPRFHAALILAVPGPHVDWFASFTGLTSLLRTGILSLIRLLGARHFWRIKDEYQSIVDPVKATYFKSILDSGAAPKTFTSADDYFEIKFIATDAAFRGRGLCPALVRAVQEKARREGKPVWMEASNAKAQRQYVKCGFRNVRGALVLGKGVSGGDGEKIEGSQATGVLFWPMVWWPEGVLEDWKVCDV